MASLYPSGQRSKGMKFLTKKLQVFVLVGRGFMFD